MRSKKPLLVIKDNHLVEAAYQLTLAEQRLLLLTIAQIDSRSALDAGTCHTISVDEMAMAYDLPNKQAYDLLRDATERLYERSLILYAPNTDEETRYTLTRWVSTARFNPQSRTIDIYFAPGILPFISQLKREFASYWLEHISRMTSIYAIRLYEMLIQWRSVGERIVDIAWLRERLELAEKYPNIRDLKNRVLVPAVGQINAHSDLWVKWVQRKCGRRIIAFHFTFGEKTTESADKNPQREARITRAYIERHARPGESWEQAEVRLRRELDTC